MVKSTEHRIAGISIGDLNGIGGEIILKTFEDNRVLENITPVLFANVKTMSYIKRSINSNANLHGIDSLDQLVHGKINVLNLWKEAVEIQWGQNSDTIGQYAIKSFKAATEALKNGQIDVLITAPINKYNIQSEEFNFPGHTDYLDQELEGEALMLMVRDNLRVGLLTDHLPVNEVAAALTTQRIQQKIRTLNKTLVRDFTINKPRIAVLGLNPHAGDQGVIGNEENEIIAPALAELFDQGILAFGPYSADGFFGSGQYEQFDAVLAMYHDQGLIPFKTLAFGKGVNYTAGLNKIRTSPDHGTAYDLAGKNLADFESFKQALYLAIDVYNARNEYDFYAQNPLKIKEKSPESKKGN